METNEIFYDAVIIGGSYAGLSAALGLGRARRRVLVVDSGQPCNMQTPHSHNFLTQDGNTPAGIAAIAKAQVLAYPTVVFLEEMVTGVSGTNNNFQISLSEGSVIQAKKLIFATGIRDIMPEIPGFKESWGISVIHCPYCHGYEYSDMPTGILMNGPGAFDFGRLIRNWTNQLTIFTNGVSTIPVDNLNELNHLDIAVNEGKVESMVQDRGYLSALILADGSKVALNALYARLPFEQHCQFPIDLGCAVTEQGHLQVTETQLTSVDGIYAAGDNSSPFRAVSGAVAAGAKAAAMLNHDLIAGK